MRLLALLVLTTATPSANAFRMMGSARRCGIISASASAAPPATSQLLAALAESGPVGVDTSEEAQAQIERLASELDGAGSVDAQARVPLKGTYDLLYSMAKGGSNGKVGPFVGAVSQIIVDEQNFINQVSLFGGAVVVQLHAQREVIDDNKIRVQFVETVFQLFGNEVKRQPTQGKGVWEQLYVAAGDDGSDGDGAAAESGELKKRTPKKVPSKDKSPSSKKKRSPKPKPSPPQE